MEREVVYNCLNDVAFKRIFKDKEILAFYIKMITNIDLNPSDISEISNEIKTSFNLKGNRYDVSIGVDDKLFLDIEAQNGIDNNLHFTRRMIHYS